MLKYIVVAVMIVAVAHSQRRPTYAGSGNRYPAVLPQYLNEQQTTSGSVDNRIDDSTDSATPILPPEANGNWSIIEWIKTWPEEKQPFWFRNWKHIQEHIGAKSSEPPSGWVKPSFSG